MNLQLLWYTMKDISHTHQICFELNSRIFVNSFYRSEPSKTFLPFSKELVCLSGEDSRNDDGSRGDLSTASDDVNANNATVSTTLGSFLHPRHASFYPQEALPPREP